jgi:hypothetical protein
MAHANILGDGTIGFFGIGGDRLGGADRGW